MESELPGNVRLRNALVSPPPVGATFASFVLFASLAALLAMVYAGWEWWNGGGSFGFSSDLGWTRAVFARNVASGHGLTFNPGAPVAGAAAPAWIGPLALVGYLVGFVFGAKLIAVACVVLAAFLAWRITLDLLGDWRFAFLAGLLVASSPRLIEQAMGGSEGALAALLVAATIYWQSLGWMGSRRSRTATAAAAGLTALARPDLILVLPLLLVDRWLVAAWHGRLGRRLSQALAHSLPEFLGAGLVVTPYLVFNSRAGGPLWQQPELALRPQAPVAWIGAVARGLWANNPLLLCAAMLGLPVAALAAARATSRHPSFLLVLTPIVALIAPAFIWRYADADNAALAVAYLVPVIAILGSAGLFFLKRAAGQALLSSRTRAGRIAHATGIALVVTGLAVLAGFAHSKASQQDSFLVRKVNDLQGYIGRWAADHTAPDAAIASREIGAIGFFSRRRMVDLGGTIDQQGLDYLRRPGSPDSNLLAFLQKTHPSYLAIRPSDFPNLSQRVDLLTPAVTCSEQDPFAGGVTTWVLYETAWPAPSARAARPQPPPERSTRRHHH